MEVGLSGLMDDELRQATDLSCTVVVPCRNEVDNVGGVVARVPKIGRHVELIFVDDGSTDGTSARVERLIAEHPEKDIKLLRRTGAGCKAAAVYQGFDAAAGDVLMILDADMTVPPEDLPRFFEPLNAGRSQFVNGTRFRRRMEEGAMPLANNLGNRAFSLILSWLVGTRITDTLCGTKAIRRRDWPSLSRVRPLFGNHDRWGDFDLLLAAGYCGLRIEEVAVSYAARVAGESKMRPLHHGVALARTCLAGALRLKVARRAEGST